ncbi:Uncharacterized protein SCF082_LOCUS3896 [Durusdinium trenchii]|uniref:Uncharacterized protein n=2 Tax=Durusdinium trenchii TaxID=1381693 RepID=A0ABP0HVU9_9DINO
MTVPNPWLRRDQTAMCGSRGTCVGGSRVSFAHVMEVVDLDSATVERVALSKNERPAKHLRDFLAKHKFLHADRPRPSYVKGPEMYPIHVAAALGNAHILRMLLDADLWSLPESRLRFCESCNVSGFLEVYIQTLAFQKFLETGQLLPEVPKRWRIEIPEFDNECYLMGLIGALREMERYAVNRGQDLDLRSVQICLQLGQSLEEVLMQFNFRNSSLRQRFDGVKYSVKRLESLSYEIDLARQRAGSPPRQGGLETEGGLETTALSLQTLEESKIIYDQFDENREQVMKQSRDVVKSAKNAIYALQRLRLRADSQIELCAEQANAIYAAFACNSPTLRLGFFSGALEEMAEAIDFFGQRWKTLGFCWNASL